MSCPDARGRRGRGLPLPALCAAVVLAVASAGCRSDEASAPERTDAAASGQESPAEGAGEEREGPTPTAEVRAKVREQIRNMRHHPNCNRIMGCDPGVAIFQHGPQVVPILLEAIEKAPRDAGYWMLELIDLLGQLDDPRALPILHGFLTDDRWQIRAHAVRAVARMGRAESLEPVRRAWEELRDEPGRLPSKAAILHALDRLDASTRIRGPAGADAAGASAAGGEAESRTPEALLRRLVPTDREALGRLNPGKYAFLLAVVREAELREALPAVRWGAVHRNRFVREQALETLAALRDTAGIPYAVTRLDDDLGSIREQAVKTLQAITGTKSLTRPRQWRAWCDSRNCLAPLRERGLLEEAAPASDGADGSSGGPKPDAR